MTDAPPSSFQDRINTAVATACPRHSHCDLVGPAVWAVVRPELEQPYAEAGELATELADARTELQQQDEEIKRLREQVAEYENGITWHTTCLNCAKLLNACHTETTRAEQAEAELEAAEDLHGCQLRDRDAEIAEAEKQIREANAALAVWREDHRLAQAHLGRRLDQRLEATATVLALARIATDTIDETEVKRDQLKKLLEEALHLRMHGERAPGGNENWRDWERKTERVLRAMLEQQAEPCADHGPALKTLSEEGTKADRMDHGQ